MAETVALTLKAAEEFLKAHGRHYSAPAEPVAAIGLWSDGALHGAAILGCNEAGEAQLAHIYVEHMAGLQPAIWCLLAGATRLGVQAHSALVAFAQR